MSSQKDINSFFLNALKKQDKDATDVLATSNQIKLFRYDVRATKWAAGDLGGTLLFYRRCEKPSFGLVLLARDSIGNWFKKFDCNVEIQIRLGQGEKPAFLLYRSTDPQGVSIIEGLSFPDNQRCELMYKTIMDTTAQQSSFPSYASMVSGQQQKHEETKKGNDKKANQGQNYQNSDMKYPQRNNGYNGGYVPKNSAEKKRESPEKSNQPNPRPFKAYGNGKQAQQVPKESSEGDSNGNSDAFLDDPAILNSSSPAVPSSSGGQRFPLLSFPPVSPQKFPSFVTESSKVQQNKQAVSQAPQADLHEGSKYLRSFIGLSGPSSGVAAETGNEVLNLSTSSVDQSNSSTDEDDQTKFAREVAQKLSAHVELQTSPNNSFNGQPGIYENGGQFNSNANPGSAGNSFAQGSTTFYNSGVAGAVFNNHLPSQMPLRPPHDFGLVVDKSNVQPLLLPQHMEPLQPERRRVEPELNSLKLPISPLTKEQLMQAMDYLLRNDRHFIAKIHEAYVKSLMDNLKL